MNFCSAEKLDVRRTDYYELIEAMIKGESQDMVNLRAETKNLI